MSKAKKSDLINSCNVSPKGPYHEHYIKAFVNNTYNNVFDFDVYLPSIGKNLQRGLVWTLDQKRELIKSIIKEVEIQPMYAIKSKERGTELDRLVTYKIIDGKQRLSTMFEFVRNEFTLLTKDGREVYCKDLDDDTKRLVELYTPRFMIYFEYYDTKLSDQQLIDWFEFINFAGTPQDQAHLESLKQ